MGENLTFLPRILIFAGLTGLGGLAGGLWTPGSVEIGGVRLGV